LQLEQLPEEQTEHPVGQELIQEPLFKMNPLMQAVQEEEDVHALHPVEQERQLLPLK
jgi:hypothetical protein